MYYTFINRVINVLYNIFGIFSYTEYVLGYALIITQAPPCI